MRGIISFCLLGGSLFSPMLKADPAGPIVEAGATLFNTTTGFSAAVGTGGLLGKIAVEANVPPKKPADDFSSVSWDKPGVDGKAKPPAGPKDPEAMLGKMEPSELYPKPDQKKKWDEGSPQSVPTQSAASALNASQASPLAPPLTQAQKKQLGAFVQAVAESGPDSLRADAMVQAPADVADTWQAPASAHGGGVAVVSSASAVAVPAVISTTSQDPRDRLRTAIDEQVRSGSLSFRQGERLFDRLAPLAGKLDQFGDDVSALQRAAGFTAPTTLAAANTDNQVRVANGGSPVTVSVSVPVSVPLPYGAARAAAGLPAAGATVSPTTVLVLPPAAAPGVGFAASDPTEQKPASPETADAKRARVQAPLYGNAVDVPTGNPLVRSLASSSIGRAPSIVAGQSQPTGKLRSLISKFVALWRGGTPSEALAEKSEEGSALRAPSSIAKPVARALASMPLVGAAFHAAVGEIGTDDETVAGWLCWFIPVLFCALVARAIAIAWRRQVSLTRWGLAKAWVTSREDE